MSLPFTRAEFFEVFARYNEAVWPLQLGFYALALAAQLAGAADATNVTLAWAYVGSRVVHSLVQATRNVIPVRFAVFALGSVLLMILLVRTALQL